MIYTTKGDSEPGKAFFVEVVHAEKNKTFPSENNIECPVEELEVNCRIRLYTWFLFFPLIFLIKKRRMFREGKSYKQYLERKRQLKENTSPRWS